MPFVSNYPYSPGSIVGPSTQLAYPDENSTFADGAALTGSDAGYVEFPPASSLGDSPSVTLEPLNIPGFSTVAISGEIRSGGWDTGAYVVLRTYTNTIANRTLNFIWRPGEQAFYEEVRIVGEQVALRVYVDDTQETTTTVFTLNLFAMSL